MKKLFIAEKPSVARQFADALKVKGKNGDGYIESDEYIVTWCVGHLITMSYPEAYDVVMKKWSLETIPFIPDTFKYEVIGTVKKQFKIVAGLLNRDDVECIYVCTDSGREGEYIYRLVDDMAKVPKDKKRLRVWIDSQTEEEILRGIREAKPLNEYDNLSSAAYLRAKEDYLMGINFSRALTLKYGYPVKDFLGADKAVISVGRVMTCVLGMIVRREREIRDFKKTPFYRVVAKCAMEDSGFEAEWKAVEGSRYFNSPLLYKENGFKEEKTAKELIGLMTENDEPDYDATLIQKEKKTEKKNPPLLYNLAELQNDCSKLFKISPDETLKVVQELYERKLVTYPRTDARVLSTAVAKEIDKNIRGLMNYEHTAQFAAPIINQNAYSGVVKSKYVNDKLITDHYAIIPTGQAVKNLQSMSDLHNKVYEIIARRFIAIFYPPAEYVRYQLVVERRGEKFFAGFKMLKKEGYLKVMQYSFTKKKTPAEVEAEKKEKDKDDNEQVVDASLLEKIEALKKGDTIGIRSFEIKEGETSPPKRYNSGSLILAMENAGQLIEDEELRAQIKGSGIGTSATRAEIIKKLVNIKYLDLNKKTQIITPTQLGEMVHDVVYCSIGALLVPNLTASWEKGLTMVAEGTVSEDDYMKKLDAFVSDKTNAVKSSYQNAVLNERFRYIATFYKTPLKKGKSTKKKGE